MSGQDKNSFAFKIFGKKDLLVRHAHFITTNLYNDRIANNIASNYVCYKSYFPGQVLSYRLVLPAIVGYSDYLDWLFSESVFSEAFMTKSAQDGYENGVLMNVEADNNYMWAAMISVRSPYENPKFLGVINEVKGEVGMNLAFLKATFLYSGEKFHGVALNEGTDKEMFLKKDTTNFSGIPAIKRWTPQWGTVESLFMKRIKRWAT